MTEPRLSPISESQGERLAEDFGLPARTGSLLAFRMIANQPDLARGIFTQHAAVRHEGRLSDRLRELLIMRVAWRAGSAYEWSQHWRIAVGSGVPADHVASVKEWHEADCFSPADRAVLQAVDDVFDHGEVPPATWARCSEALGDPLLALEVAVATVHWRGLAVLFRTLAIPLEEGTTAWPPDDRSPADAVPPKEAASTKQADAFAPLAGVRVLDFSKVLAGPLCTQYLADMGADVVKVEHIDGGDDTRQWPPFADGAGTIFLSANRNKRSIALDLKSEEGRAVCLQLAAAADVVVESFGPGVAERLQVDAATLAICNPRLVHCSITGFGATGPLREGKGYDLVLQAYSGMLSMTGDAGAPPARSPFSPVDQGTGLHALSGILAGLLQRDRTGRGVRVEASLFDTAAAFLGYLLQGYWQRGTEPLRVGSGHESLCPYQSFETKDRPLILGVASDGLWRTFCAVAGVPQLAQREDLATNPQRVALRAEVVAQVQTVLATRTRADWMPLFHAAGIPCSPVHSLGEFAADHHLEASGMVFDYPATGGTTVRGVAQPLRFDGQRVGARRLAPRFGADTAQVLAEAGFDAAAIDALFTRGVVSAPATPSH